MSYREAPPAKPIESAWDRYARQARRAARWPLDRVRMWHLVALLTLGPSVALITYYGVWGRALRGAAMLCGGLIAGPAALFLIVCIIENWARPIAKWRWPK